MIPIQSLALASFLKNVLAAHKVKPTDAEVIVNAMVAADLTGHDTHGSQRLPSYLAPIRAGVMSATAQPIVTYPAPAVARVAGQNAFGHLVAAAAIDAASELACTYGIGMAGCLRSNHFGTSAWVVERAVEKGFGALVFTNSSPAMPAWGSKEKTLGVSPLACEIPGTPPFVLDMAPSVAARGKVYKALRRGESIPEGWALDKDGKRTTDPAAALEGTMLPMGGPKGSALAIMMDAFSGLLTGAAFAGGVISPHDPSRPADVGHFIVTIKPDLFMSTEDVSKRLDGLRDSVTGSERATGSDRVWFPGEREMECRLERTRGGIPFTKHEVEALNQEARAVGVKELEAA